MNADRLLASFERIADTPDAVLLLRRFILDLAVRGKLVPQAVGGEPVSELLNRIAKEHQVEGGARKARPLVSVPRDARPFGTPPGWEFVRLGAVLEMVNGRAFKPTEWIPSGLPIVRIQNLNNANAPFNYCDPKTVDDRHLIRDDEFLISWSGTPGTSFGAFIWSRGVAALNQHIFRCIQVGDAFFPKFLRIAINSQLDILIRQAQGGVGLQHVTKGKLEALPLPLPPPAEQHRIVAKVDELMVRCDLLVASLTKAAVTRRRLLEALLHEALASDGNDKGAA
jgi:type I restriction enzyme S subunit